MAQATSVDPRSDFWQAFFDRTNKWAYMSQQRAAFFADCACAQAMFECAAWTSNLYLTNNNAIGYEYYSLSDWQDGPGIARPAAEGGNYADYATLGNCACELADWIHRRQVSFSDVEDIDGYLDTMSQLGYAAVPASQYAHAEQYYSVTDMSSYSPAAPSIPAALVGLVETGSDTNYGLILLGAVAVVVLISVVGFSKLLKMFRL